MTCENDLRSAPAARARPVFAASLVGVIGHRWTASDGPQTVPRRHSFDGQRPKAGACAGRTTVK